MDKDRQFGKKTTFKIIDFIIESGVSLVPGGTIPYNAIKKIIEVAKDYHNFKTEQKIHQFHIALLNGENMDEFSNKECDIDDYTSLLNCCLQDIEDEKAEIYRARVGGAYTAFISGVCARAAHCRAGA